MNKDEKLAREAGIKLNIKVLGSFLCTVYGWFHICSKT